MAFTATKLDQSTVFGNLRVQIWKYVNDGGSTGGDITTGLSQVLHAIVQPFAASIFASQSVVNESVGAMTDPVTLVNNANESGQVIIFGR